LETSCDGSPILRDVRRLCLQALRLEVRDHRIDHWL
jgi:hypothetical protein